MSLQNAINTPAGEYLKEFEATISQAKSQPTKTGKTFWKALATDGQFKANLTCFSQTFEHFEGKRVKFSGMGIKRGDDYNGTAQISIGDKTKWTAVGDGAASQPQDQNPPSTQQERSQLVDRPRGPEGASVGNALTNSTQLAIAQKVEPTKLEDFLFEQSSKLLRVSQRLMAGELAPQSPSKSNNSAPDEGVPF